MTESDQLSKTGLQEKERRKIAGLIYVAFFAVVLFLHKDVFACSDDIVFRNYLREYTVLEQAARTWNCLSGKILTDTLGAILTLLPYSVWSIGDSLIWMLLFVLFNCMIYDEPAHEHLTGMVFLSFLFLMFPISYLTSAGFILTSTNYVYPAVCDTFIIWRIVKHIRNRSIPPKKVGRASLTLESVLLMLAAVFGAGQEQSAVILIAILIIIMVKLIKDYLTGNSASADAPLVLTLFSLAGAFGGIISVLLAPGHIIRSKVMEGTFCVPGYAQWTFADKIIRGYSSTVANLIYYQTWLYVTLCILVFLLGLCCKNKALKILSCLPAVYSVTALVYAESFSYFPDYGFGMKELIDFELKALNVMSYIVPLLVFLLICLLIYNGFKNKTSAVSLIIVLVLSLGSRIAMGFSATLYGSSFRTFIFVLIALIYCNGMVFRQLYAENRKAAYAGLLICSVIAVGTVYLNAEIITLLKYYA